MRMPSAETDADVLGALSANCMRMPSAETDALVDGVAAPTTMRMASDVTLAESSPVI